MASDAVFSLRDGAWTQVGKLSVPRQKLSAVSNNVDTVWFLGGLIRHPHLVVAEGLRVRMNSGIDFMVPWKDVASVSKRYRSMASSKSVQVEEGALHIVVGSQTIIDVRLRRPLVFDVPRGPGEPVDEVRLYADDSDGLVRAARAHLEAYAE